MKLSYISEYDVLNPDLHSGTPFWIRKSLLNQNIDLKHWHITSSQRKLPPFQEFIFLCKQFLSQHIQNKFLDSESYHLRIVQMAERLSKSLDHLNVDAILTSITPMIGSILETNIPIVYWTDAVYDALVGFYPQFRFLHSQSLWEGHALTKTCLTNAKLLIFSSEWAARTAVELYGVSKQKIKVVHFGANIDVNHSLHDVNNIIQGRSKDCLKLLFIGKDFNRKGGDIALEIADQLFSQGYAIELTMIGCDFKNRKLSPYVKSLGLLSKKNPNDLQTLIELYKQSHFLILPSRADACPISFAEANAFGVPCITSTVGGIPDAIIDDINGKTFSLESPIKDCCDYMVNLFNHYPRYAALALSSFNEYQTRLNWVTASQKVKQYISAII